MNISKRLSILSKSKEYQKMKKFSKNKINAKITFVLLLKDNTNYRTKKQNLIYMGKIV